MRCLLLLIFTCCLLAARAQKLPDYEREARLLIRKLKEQHYSPKPVDDVFAGQVFDALLREIDPDKLFFTEADIKPLLKYRSLLDDELNGTGWKFLQDLTTVYKASLQRSAAIIEEQSAAPFKKDFREFFEYDTAHWSFNEQERVHRWRHWLKYQAFERLVDKQKSYTGNTGDFYTRYEPETRQRVKQQELRSIKRILNHASGFESFLATAYFQVIASVFDPHTSYLPLTAMENFMASLSTEGYYFGVTLDENDRGDVLIAALAPGGPAWKSGELHASDILVSLQWEGQERIDVTGLSLEEANQVLADDNHQMMDFTVQQASGIAHTVRLRKEKISLEENYARSYLLKDKYTIGYISLPDFYTRWSDESEGTRCASDVAKEILNLKKEHIDGLILDVRYNGGGSLQEAMAMAGIFIDEGALGILKDKTQHATTLKDMNRGTVYDGPLILMVNGQSASASEFLAAALQDYNRAVIVGSATFGKATAQNFFPLDPAQKPPSLDGTLKSGTGYASITTDKIYRVTGRAVQGRGVRPDVLLPDILEVLDLGEARLPFALPLDSVIKKTYYRPQLPLPLLPLRKNSEARVEASAPFQEVLKSRAWLAAEVKKRQEPVLLLWDDFNQHAAEQTKHYAALEQAFSQSVSTYTVSNSQSDQQRVTLDDYTRKFNDTWLKKLRKDIYLAEAFHVMADLIEETSHK
ncbi:MAG TPA: carboxy terminal-processing peptidase [Ohtaekwangia sp.]|uniref:carboxy terminal-processing peptidase n=1 Tax=Ohtaekwangia sp. TaxID=2066019 RepID=UPI002F952CC0